MTFAFACVVWPAVLTIAVVLLTRSARWRPWRKRLSIVTLCVWLLGTGALMASFFRGTAIFDGVKSGRTERVKELLDKKPSLIQARTLEGETPLHTAVNSGDEAMVAFLLQAGADVNAGDSSRVTPLHLAAFRGSASIAGVLLQHGAEVNAVGYRHNDTPLHVAAFHGHADVVRLLLAHGANPDAEDMHHKTPLQLAQEKQQTNVVAVLSGPLPPKQ